MIKIVEEYTGGIRPESSWHILINGKVFTTPEGYSSFWTEAEALRYCYRNFGVMPLED